MPGMRVVEAIRSLLEQVGPAILVTHSMAGAFGWKLAELCPDRVRAIVGVAPSPPGNIQPWWSWPAYPEDRPIEPMAEEVRHFTDSPTFPNEAFDRYYQSIVPESARIYNERLNVRGMQLQVEEPARLRGTPMLVVSAERDPNHAGNTDSRTADFLGAEHISLADLGLRDHGHLMMLEHGNLAIADVILGWLDRHLR